MNDEARKRKIEEQGKTIDALLEKISALAKEKAGLRKCITLMGIFILILICIIGLSVGNGQAYCIDQISDKKCHEAVGGIEIKDGTIFVNVLYAKLRKGEHQIKKYILPIKKDFWYNDKHYYDVGSKTVAGFFIVESNNEHALLTIYQKKEGYYMARYTFKQKKL